MEEYYFTCPYCWEQISVLIDMSLPAQTYIENCEVCCNPIQITYEIGQDDVAFFAADPAN